MFGIDPKNLVDNRNQLHWACQLLSAAADAKLEKADDDSHSNLGWNGSSSQMEGRADVSFDVTEFALKYEDDTFSLIDLTLEDAGKWLSEKIGGEIKFRDYEMPQHEVGKGGKFSPNAEHLKPIADWFSFGQNTLSENGELRVWPHHFDLGFWTQTAVEGKSIGGGFSLGDHYFAQPYFYVNPYGIDRPDSLPDLAHGHWTEHWMGAVLTAEDLGQGEPDHIAKHFASEAVSLCQNLLK